MDDDFDVLAAMPELSRLLQHYAPPAASDREAWQDRLMELDGVSAKDLTRLHGELIAQGWLEQNTGVTPFVRPGVVAGCYRLTSLGFRQANGIVKRQAA